MEDVVRNPQSLANGRWERPLSRRGESPGEWKLGGNRINARRRVAGRPGGAPRPCVADAMLKPGRGGDREVGVELRVGWKVGPRGSREEQESASGSQGPSHIWDPGTRFLPALPPWLPQRMSGTGRSWQLLEFSRGKCPRPPPSGEVTPFFVLFVCLFLLNLESLCIAGWPPTH